MIRLDPPSLCCGCGACVAICSKHCVRMEKDACGFVYPQVDELACIDCGLCESICPVASDVISDEGSKLDVQECFAAYSKDSGVRFRGSSGGMFETFARKILEENGVVYGAAFDDNFQLKTRRVDKLEDLPPLLKSKYLLCDCSEAFESIRKDLQSGRLTLYCTTPCQIRAVKNFLCKDYDNFITVGFFCHGVPSQDFFDRCRAYVERKKRIKILKYEFRSKKRRGATPHYFSMTYQTRSKKQKSILRLYVDSPFLLAFQKKYAILRDSCYSCKFAGREQPSDIIIGDFHTIEKHIAGVYRMDGVSMVILNTTRGNTFWNRCVESLWTQKVDLDLLIANREAFSGPTPRPGFREQLMNDLQSKDFDQVIKKYYNVKNEWTKRIYYAAPFWLRRVVKRFLGM